MEPHPVGAVIDTNLPPEHLLFIRTLRTLEYLYRLNSQSATHTWLRVRRKGDLFQWLEGPQR